MGINVGNIMRTGFKNNHVVYEQTVKCEVKDYEFNASYNPTLTTGSVGFLFESASSWMTGSSLPDGTNKYYTLPDNELKSFATASYFAPYVTTVGLYNDSGDLLAVAKMAQPLPLSNKTDLTILLKMDY